VQWLSPHRVVCVHLNDGFKLSFALLDVLTEKREGSVAINAKLCVLDRLLVVAHVLLLSRAISFHTVVHI
jgi:hypothetical protein